MSKWHLLLAVGVWRISLPLSVLHAAEPDSQMVEFFEKEVRPVLVSRCYACHSAAGKQRGGLVLDSRAGWQQGGDSGPALKPGDADASLLVQAVRYADDGLKMPPSGKMPAHEIEALVKWVRLGAPDPRDGKGPKAGSSGLHWSYQPPRRPGLPLVRDTAWCWSDVDRFLRAQQEQAGVHPVGDADRHALIRRATFDLIGLPPTPADVDAFVNDQSPDAFARLVDRLLASPHFGERWGRHWLDLARYAESLGSDNDYLLMDAWRYRDYVINAFNRDKPYDRFIIEQLAGDLLPAANAAARDEQVIATGFLALGHFDSSKVDPQLHLDRIDEQIDVTTRALLATTVSCARCHDHKYDPIPTRDYYALAGIFSSTDVRKMVIYTKGKHTFVRANLGVPLQGFRPEPVEEFIRLQQEMYDGRNPVVRMGWEYNKHLAATRQAKNPAEAAKLQGQADQIKREMDRRLAAAKAAEQRLRGWPPLPPMALAVQDHRPHDQAVRIRGEFDNHGPVVPRGFLTALTPGKAPAIHPEQSGRLELAHWIASRDNPATARVLVNRVWLHLFGAGLVPTVDNFGVNGERPSHPELLDHLAIHFMAEGWSIKKLIRQLMLSHVYQLSVARNSANENIDGDNRLLWRMNRRRLEAEAIRDTMLAFAGRLDLQPRERSLIADLGVGAMRFLSDQVHFNEAHRSIFLPQPRGKMAEVIALFDGPDRKEVVGQREVTTVPPQALFLLNSPFALDHARFAAERLLAEPHCDDASRIDRAFRLALGRPPSVAEIATARRFLADHERAAAPEPVQPVEPAKPLTRAQKKKAAAAARENAAIQAPLRLRAWSGLCQLLMASPEFRYIH